MSYVAQAQAQYADAAKKNKENADAYKQSVGEIFDTQRDQVNKQAEADTQKVGSQYKGLYDEAALQQLVNERNLKQRQASLGLTDSGLTASQQTAIQVSRGNADAKISAQKQAAIDSITLQLEQYLAQIEQNRASSFAEIDYNLNTTNTNLYNTLMSQAYSNQAALDAANAQAEATIEAARIAAAEKATSEAKSNENTYYKRAKDLRDYAGDDSAWRYLNGLAGSGNIDSQTLRTLCYSLGIDYTKYTTPTPAPNNNNIIATAIKASNYAKNHREALLRG
ncbi:MAG: hypothetical protein IIW79_02710 [Clostridia bacterium]|nr:hypothetical protein [Clostridia bacterium]